MPNEKVFNLEYKITYDELSPSLQAMFRHLQDQIIDNRNEITNLNERCDELEDRCDSLENRMDIAETNINYLQSIQQHFEIIGEQTGYPIGINTINMVDGKQLLTQYFVVQHYTSGGGNPETAFTITYPKPMDRVISIQVEDAHVHSDNHTYSGYIDGEWWIRSTSVNGAGFIIQYDSVHEVDENATFLFFCQVTGYVLTGEVPEPPEIDDPGGSDSDGNTSDKINSLEERVTKLESDLPIGTVRYVYSTPDGWIELNGQLVNRSDYEELWSWANSNNLVVTDSEWNSSYVNNRSNKGLFSSGNGSTTFRLPDFRARFIRGLDNGVGYDPDRLLGTEELPTLIPGYDENLLEINQDHCDPDWSVVSGPATRFSSDIINNGGRNAINIEYTDCPSDESWGHFIYPNVKIPQGEGGNATSSDIRCSTKRYDGSNTVMDPNLLFTAARPRNIALRAVIKYK